MTVRTKICYNIAGFMLSVATVVVIAAGLQFILSSIWPHPQGLLFAFGTSLSISVAAIVSTWAALLKGLRHRAMVRGVWYQIYAVVVFAVIGLFVLMFC